MRKVFLILILTFLIHLEGKSQTNLIPNPGFESGNKNPQCNYGLSMGLNFKIYK